MKDRPTGRGEPPSLLHHRAVPERPLLGDCRLNRLL